MFLRKIDAPVDCLFICLVSNLSIYSQLLYYISDLIVNLVSAAPGRAPSPQAPEIV